MSQAIARRSMIPNRYGRIVNIGSVTSVAGYAGLGPYSASRGGIKQLTMSLADDWGSHGITVNCLAPGWFRTEQNKVMYEDPEWVAYLTDRIPLKRPGQAGRPRRRGRVPGVRGVRVRHRPDPARRRRDLDRRRARAAAEEELKERSGSTDEVIRCDGIRRGSPGDWHCSGRRSRDSPARRRRPLRPRVTGFPGQYALPPADRKFPAWPKGCARFEGEERTACFDAVASDFAGFYRYAAANAALAAPKPGESRVVFYGDSITDNWSKPEYGGFFPGKPYVNRGIGGQTTAQMLLRFRADVARARSRRWS